MRCRIRTFAWTALALVACPAALTAQRSSAPADVGPAAVSEQPHAAPAAATSTDDARPAEIAGGFDVHAMALGGFNPDLDGGQPHVAGGALLQAGVGRIGVFGLGMLGRGGSYESTLAGGGLGVRLLRVGWLDLMAFGGFGHYAELGWSGIERDAAGPLFGGLATIHAGRLAIGLAFTDLTSHYDEDDVREPFRFHVPRISIGLGF